MLLEFMCVKWLQLHISTTQPAEDDDDAGPASFVICPLACVTLLSNVTVIGHCIITMSIMFEFL